MTEILDLEKFAKSSDMNLILKKNELKTSLSSVLATLLNDMYSPENIENSKETDSYENAIKHLQAYQAHGFETLEDISVHYRRNNDFYYEDLINANVQRYKL
jgi:hypothetical protein